MKNDLRITIWPSSTKLLVNVLSCLSLLAMLVYNVSTANAQTHHWKRSNPGGGGWFSCVGAGKSGIVLAGSDLSGAYRSKDGGNTWDPLGANRGLMTTHIGGMGFHRTDGNIMFLGASGIYRTLDGGDSWDKVLDGKGYVTDIEFATDKPWIGYASRHKGNWNTKNAEIYKTTNTGKTWTRVDKNLPSTRIIKVIVNPKKASEVYLLTGSGRPTCSVADVYKSTDGGENWKNITSDNDFEGLTEVTDFAIDPQSPNILYITTVKADCSNRFWAEGREGRLYKSINGGRTWRKMQEQGGIILIHPENTSEVTLIETRAVATWNARSGTRLSKDGGATFAKVSDVGTWETTFHGNTQNTYSGTKDGYGRTIGEDLSNPNNLYWINSQWVLGSKNRGEDFKVLHSKQVRKNFWQSSGVDNLVNIDMSISPKDPNLIYLALADMGIWRSLDKGESWQNCNTEDVKYGWGAKKGGNGHSIIADPDRVGVVWATVKKGYVIKSTNKGESSSWKEASTGLTSNKYVNGLSLDINSPVNKRTLYVTANGDVHKSTDDGLHWSPVLEGNGCNFTAVDQFNGNIVYAGGINGLWRSTDSGKNWSILNQLSRLPVQYNDINIRKVNYQGIFDIKTDPNNKDWVYVSVHGFGENQGLFRSKNKGESWEKLLTDKYLRKVAITPRNSNLIYATSSSAMGSGGLREGSNGIWFSNDGGQSWKKQNQGMAYPFANSVAVTNEETPVVFVGSQGTGFQIAKVPMINTPPSNSLENIKLNGTYTIKNTSSNQNVISPIWDNHNALMYSSDKILVDHIWEFEHLGNGVHRIKNKGTNRFLEVSRAKCVNNANINTWTSGGADHQKWYITKIGNAHFIRPTHCENWALDKSSGKNGNVKLWKYTKTSANQKFELLPVGSLGSARTKLSSSDQKEISVYPNPVQGKLWLDLTGYPYSSGEYTIVTPSGTIVSKGTVVSMQNKSEPIDVKRLRTGMYIIRVSLDGKGQLDEKFFISR